MKVFNLTKNISKYKKETIGNGWATWWKYKDKFVDNPYDIFENHNILETSYRLYSYMVMFGMAKGYLAEIAADDFIKHVSFYGARIKEKNLFGIELNSHSDVQKHCKIVDDIYANLFNSNYGYTLTFTSKMLMALWGHTIAWDINFSKTFYYLFADKYSKSAINKMKWSKIFLLLFEKHMNDIGKFNNTTVCLPTVKLKIPILRLIDMAYWQYGHDYL